VICLQSSVGCGHLLAVAEVQFLQLMQCGEVPQASVGDHVALQLQLQLLPSF
jgi:hypothetical protein